MHPLNEESFPLSEICYGPMKSGKSRYLVEKAEALFARQESFLAFKPVLDTRDGSYIRSRHQTCRDVQALAVSSSQEILSQVQLACEQPAYFRRDLPQAQPGSLSLQASFRTDVPLKACLIDEVFLLDSDLIRVLEALREAQISVYMCGLDRDFRGEYFPLKDAREQGRSMQDLIEGCDRSLALMARCEVCQQPAALTQRLINGQPAPYNSPTVMIGDEEYQPRCREHHQIAGKAGLSAVS